MHYISEFKVILKDEETSPFVRPRRLTQRQEVAYGKDLLYSAVKKLYRVVRLLRKDSWSDS